MRPDAVDILRNFGYLALILETLAVIGGVWLFMAGIFLMKRYAETRTFMSHQITIAAPLMMMVGGTMLLCLPTIVSTAIFAFFGDASPEHYTGVSSGIDQYIPVVLMFVRLVGIGSMIRGIVLFSRIGGQQSPPGNMGKALIHIFGGMLCVHILGTVHLLKQILDFA